METKRTEVTLAQLTPEQIDDVLDQVEGLNPQSAAYINWEAEQIEVVGLEHISTTQRAQREARLARHSTRRSVAVG